MSATETTHIAVLEQVIRVLHAHCLAHEALGAAHIQGRRALLDALALADKGIQQKMYVDTRTMIQEVLAAEPADDVREPIAPLSAFLMEDGDG